MVGSVVAVWCVGRIVYGVYVIGFLLLDQSVQSCRLLACTIVPIVLRNTVYYAVLLMMND